MKLSDTDWLQKCNFVCHSALSFLNRGGDKKGYF